MKCYACDYEKRRPLTRINEAIFYKTGKNKGKIRDFKEILIDPDVDKEPFKQIEFRDFNDVWIYLYVCPRCGTVREE